MSADGFAGRSVPLGEPSAGVSCAEDFDGAEMISGDDAGAALGVGLFTETGLGESASLRLCGTRSKSCEPRSVRTMSRMAVRSSGRVACIFECACLAVPFLFF